MNGTRGAPWRALVLVAGPALLLLILATAGPIAQDPAYHRFADARAWLGVPAFLNVTSNLAFLVTGLLGLRRALAQPAGPSRRSWIAFFAGSALIGPGSAWYHWSPTDASLVWDRLAMAVCFTGLTVALLAERANHRIGAWLAPALAAGLASVGWWAWTGDLRPYALVQFAPVLALLPALALYPVPAGAGARENRWILAALGCYPLAKGAEWADGGIYAATGHSLSGHTLKHLAAAAGVACFWQLLRERRRGAP